MTIAWLGAAIAAFAIGAIPFGVLISRVFFRRDIRREGSGNIGAANALRTLGKRGAIAVLVLDALKGALAVWLGRAVGGDALAAVAGLLAITGHCFSPFLGGRGGKGVATALGAVFALAWPAGFVFIAVWLAVVIATGYSSAGSLSATIAMIPFLALMIGSAGSAFATLAAVIIVAKHRENLARLRAGTESVLPLFGRGKSKA